jgi:hypothetical protein
MNRYATWLAVTLFGSILLSLVSPVQVQALPPPLWVPGIEREFFGHTFAESKWTNDSIVFETPNNETVQFVASYVNYSEDVGSFQAMLLALGIVENENGTQSTLPYQLFGLHYTTRDNRDFFVGSVLAFLFGFNDTDHNGIPSPGENRFYIIPYGFNEGNATLPLTVEALPVVEIEPGHYQFGISYQNLYGRLVSANDPGEFLVSLLLNLFEITFSELTIVYDVKVDVATGEITTETYYTIGQVTEFRFLGIPVPNFHDALDDIGIGVAHAGVVLSPRYYVRPGSNTPVIGQNQTMVRITTDLIGRNQAFALGTRGSYDVYNETTPTPTLIAKGLPAYSWLLTPQPIDGVLMLWQLPISAIIFSIFAYAMSPYLQSLFPGPLSVYEHADWVFNSVAFWYGITFPEAQGYRVVHDPVYTAYSNIGQAPSLVGLILLGTVSLIALIIIVVQVIRSNGKNSHSNDA